MWHDLLMCRVSGLAYNFDDHIGRLWMGDTSCCDGSGCIELFTKIDPDVITIETFQGEKPDTNYHRRPGKKKWEVIPYYAKC